MKVKFLTVVSLVLTASVSPAETAAEAGLEKVDSRGRWTISAGPAWRSRVKVETHGTIAAPDPEARRTLSRDMSDAANWTNPKPVDDPQAGVDPVPAGSKLWGVSDKRTEIYGTAGEDYRVSRSDEERPLGLNLQGCYDFLQGETWSVGLNLRFAGYWGMESSTRGYYDAGTKLTETWQDDYIFPEEAPDAPFAPNPLYATVEPNGSKLESSVLDMRGSRAVSTRLRSDLYQIGLGPKVTWSPFVGVCDCMSWLDVYGGADVLLNLAYNRFEADGSSSSSTDCLIGFGGNVGLVGNITDWCGIYGQVGYEWIDKTDLSAGGFRADVDYSSLVLSAGIQFRF